METKKLFALFFAVICLSLGAIPAAADNATPEFCDYMARLAVGKLYVPYYALERTEEEISPERPTEEHLWQEPPQISESADVMPEGMIAVEAVNLSRYEVDETPPMLIVNETAFKAELVPLNAPCEKGAVLIMHTHGTEAYLPDGVEHYSPDEDFRTHDEGESVVAVGKVFAETLREAGIEVFHDTTMYDAADFENAYAASRAGAKDMLKKHPQIRYIIDIHRDAVSRNDAYCKTLCEGTETPTAQVMLVVGTNEAGAAHPSWRNNLALAGSYQQALNLYPTFARPVYLRRASFNQQLSSGALLLEIGSAANTITEAKNAAVLAAKSFAKVYGI